MFNTINRPNGKRDPGTILCPSNPCCNEIFLKNREKKLASILREIRSISTLKKFENKMKITQGGGWYIVGRYLTEVYYSQWIITTPRTVESRREKGKLAMESRKVRRITLYTRENFP